MLATATVEFVLCGEVVVGGGGGGVKSNNHEKPT